MAEKSPFSKPDHIEVVVRDIDKAISYYESLGIGPFRPTGVTVTERRVLGKPINVSDIVNKTRVAQIGAAQLHLSQPVRGESMQKEFLETRGEGMHHLAFSVDDIDREVAKLVGKGLKVIYTSRFQKGGGAAFFDTREVGGVLLELIQWPP